MQACIQPDSQYEKSAGFETISLPNESIIDCSLERIDLTHEFFGKKLGAPLMIAPMTGGIEKGHELNEKWARAAERFQIPMGVGSQRLGVEDPSRAPYYNIRKHAPTAFIFGNLGAAQLCSGWGIEEAKRAVDMIEADALFIHFNAMQEACQKGDVDFSNLPARLTKLCLEMGKSGIPVFAREVSFGLSKQSAKKMLDCGVSGIDCCGAGGTSWSKVEALCALSERQKRVAMTFSEWGISTVDSIRNVRSQSLTIPLIATGGLRSGLDVVKAIHLGADLGSMARPMLLAALESEESLHHFIEDTRLEIKMALFGMGFASLKQFIGQRKGRTAGV